MSHVLSLYKSSAMKRTTSNDQESGPSFDLPLENELLILKLKAEFGTECTKGCEELPPEVVNEFLNSVYDFERKFREPHSFISVYERIGKPAFMKSDSISDKEISVELKKVRSVLNAHQLELDVLGEYSDRHIYKFITEEFFHQQIEDLEMKGCMHHFCYEDFHPNYELEIRQRSIEFLTQWFSRQLGEYSWQLADPFVHPDSREFPKEITLMKMRHIFDAYVNFQNCSYNIETLSFEWDEEKQCGEGYVSGKVRYDAVAEDGTTVRYAGPFEFYLSNSGTWWSIFYFVFPGFVW